MVVCALAGCPRPPPRGTKPQPPKPKVIAKFPTVARLAASPKYAGLVQLFPEIDRRTSACAPPRKLTITDFPIPGPSRVLLVRYRGCCETRCRKSKETGEYQCGRKLYPIACAKDLLVEARAGRLASLVESTFTRFDPGGGYPKTRVFLLDLDGDKAPEVVRWEELAQFHHREWLVHAYQGTPEGLRRIADIRYYHVGQWQPDLSFADRDKNGAREIEIAVQEVDEIQRRVVVRRRIYKYDPLVGRFVIADTVVYVPPGLLRLQRQQAEKKKTPEAGPQP